MSKAETRTLINLAMRKIMNDPAKLGLSVADAVNLQRQATRLFLLAR